MLKTSQFDALNMQEKKIREQKLLADTDPYKQFTHMISGSENISVLNILIMHIRWRTFGTLHTTAHE